MTNEPEHSDVPLDAVANRSIAAEWLIARRMSEIWTDEKQLALDKWLALSPANRIAYWRLDGAWEQAQRLTALRQPMRAPVTPASPLLSFRLFKVAVALIVVAVLGTAGTAYLQQSEFRTYTTPVGGQLTISLADGSKINLNTDTVLRVRTGSDKRQAVLDRGEAYFQIVHDAAKPFVLSVGNQRVIDLGTVFSVRKKSDKVVVALFEGRAKVEAENAHAGVKPAVLEPGEIAVATLDSIKISKATTKRDDDLAWRRGMLTFKSVTLAQAADEFNRYNSTKIIIADPQVAQLEIHGAFAVNDVMGFADAAQAYFKLHIKNRNGEIVISH